MRLFLSCCLIVVMSVPQTAWGCLWDSDTLQQERSSFPKRSDVDKVPLPGALELVIGYFPRHSDAYYQWRIQDREQQIQTSGSSAHPNARLIDDIAVAHDKLGNHAKAIELMEAQYASNPKRYETLANLGTFYIHNGELEKGTEFIRRAIEINPIAHFGREVYQLLLVEYVIERRAAGHSQLPLFEFEERLNPVDFADFLVAKRESGEYAQLNLGADNQDVRADFRLENQWKANSFWEIELSFQSLVKRTQRLVRDELFSDALVQTNSTIGSR